MATWTFELPENIKANIMNVTFETEDIGEGLDNETYTLIWMKDGVKQKPIIGERFHIRNLFDRAKAAGYPCYTLRHDGSLMRKANC